MCNEVKVGVVTVTYNSEAVIQPFMDDILGQDYRNLVAYVVDNSSIDGTLKALGNCKDARVAILRNERNVGIAEGNNIGIRAAIGDGCGAVLLINNDTEFPANLVTHLVDGLSKHDASIVVPKMMYFDDPGKIWAAGGKFEAFLGYRQRHFGENEIDIGQFDQPRRIDFAPMCCMLIKAEVFTKVGLMDWRYFVYTEDVDFMLRSKRAGIRASYLPSVKLFHKVGSLTGGKESDFAVRYGTRNKIFFWLKHFGVACSLPFLVMYQAYIWGRFLLRRDSWSRLKTRQKAYFEGIRLTGTPL